MRLVFSSDWRFWDAGRLVGGRIPPLGGGFWTVRCLETLSVELRGFEPLTLSMPWRCATSCAIAPWS